jgi:hypothetical protein
MTAQSLHENFAGRRRRDPVLRDTVDYLDPKATQARLLGDGTYDDERDCQQAMLQTLELWQSESVTSGAKHSQGDFGRSGIRVAQVIIEFMKPHSGLCDLSYSQIAEQIGGDYDTAMDWTHKLKALRALDYQRRSVPTGAPKAWQAPQRAMTTSVIWLTPERMPQRYHAIYLKLRDGLREQRRLVRERQEEDRRELARELEIARDREYSRQRMTAILAARRASAQENGTPPKRRRSSIRLLDPYKVNPRVMERIDMARKEAIASSKADEERDAARVAANVENLRAQMLARCG